MYEIKDNIKLAMDIILKNKKQASMLFIGWFIKYTTKKIKTNDNKKIIFFAKAEFLSMPKEKKGWKKRVVNIKMT